MTRQMLDARQVIPVTLIVDRKMLASGSLELVRISFGQSRMRQVSNQVSILKRVQMA